MTSVVRYAEKSDYERVEALMKEVQLLHVGWRPDIYKAVDTVCSREHFDLLITEKRLFVAETDGMIVGLISFLYRHTESEKQFTRHVLFVDALAVEEGYRNRGIGTQLLDQLREKVRSEHLDGIELQVNAKNTSARKMYETYGFTEKSSYLELCVKNGNLTKCSSFKQTT